MYKIVSLHRSWLVVSTLLVSACSAGTSDNPSGGSGGSAGAPSTCPSTQVECNGACIDLATSAVNCGQCGKACGTGQTCVNGACACPTGQTACSGQCTGVAYDPSNCGACGTVCGTGQVCTNGSCQTSCATGETECNRACVNLGTNAANCGSCGNACAPDHTCTNGACTCPAGTAECSGSCVNTGTDASNCGTCGKQCGGGQTCTAGACVGGNTGGTGGTTGGTGGTVTGGTGGTTGGTGGTVTGGTGGTTGGTGGTVTGGTGGTVTGGTGGTTGGTGGTTGGTGGTVTGGTGGTTGGTGGTTGGTGGTTGGTGGTATGGTGGTTTTCNFYVSPTGSDSNTGTIGSPFATMARGQTAASAGSVVCFRGGRYVYTAGTTTCSSQTATINAITLTKSGTSGNRIRYIAYPGETPVFDFSGIKDSCRITGIRLTASWVELNGLEVMGVPQNNNLNHESWGIWNSGSNNIFQQLNAHNNMGPGIFIQRGANNLVLNCDSHDNYDPLSSTGAGTNGDGFGCHIGAGDTGNVIRGCRAWSNSDDGYDFIQAQEVVTIENSWSWSNGYVPGTTTHAGDGNGFKAGGYGNPPVNPPANPPHHVVRDCLAFLNYASGFYANHHTTYDYFYNNTAFNNRSANFNMLGATANVGVLRNNLAFTGTALANGTGVDSAFNSWDLAVTVSNADFVSVATTGMNAPRKADGSLPDITFMHLVSGSDLIDKGTNVGLPFNGAAPDLGAFEF